MHHYKWDLGHQAAGTSVRVDLDGTEANVRLLDSSNYSRYAADQSHRYADGGHYKVVANPAAGSEQRLLVRRDRLRRLSGPSGRNRPGFQLRVVEATGKAAPSFWEGLVFSSTPFEQRFVTPVTPDIALDKVEAA